MRGAPAGASAAPASASGSSRFSLRNRTTGGATPSPSRCSASVARAGSAIAVRQAHQPRRLARASSAACASRPPSTSIRNCRLDPPPGVRRQPARPSKRTSRAATLHAAGAVGPGAADRARRRGARRSPAPAPRRVAMRATAPPAQRARSAPRSRQRCGIGLEAVGERERWRAAPGSRHQIQSRGERRSRAAAARRSAGETPIDGGACGDEPRRDDAGRRRGRDEEQPRPRLRQELAGVDRQRAEAVAAGLQRRSERGEIGAAARGQQAADVFQHDQSRRAAARPPSACISRQNGQNAPDRRPSSPAPAPASERSWQGNEAQARSARPGGRAPRARRRPRRASPSAPKFSA